MSESINTNDNENDTVSNTSLSQNNNNNLPYLLKRYSTHSASNVSDYDRRSSIISSPSPIITYKNVKFNPRIHVYCKNNNVNNRNMNTTSTTTSLTASLRSYSSTNHQSSWRLLSDVYDDQRHYKSDDDSEYGEWPYRLLNWEYLRIKICGCCLCHSIED